MNSLRTFRPDADIPAGVAVGLVLIPQALAYAELAGMPPERGLVAGVAATVAAAWFASSPYLQTGPTALTGLLTLVAIGGLATPFSQDFVALGVLLALVVGTVRLAIGLLRLHGVARLLSPPVVRGFVLGAALLIGASQVPSALGLAGGEGGLMAAALAALSEPNSWSPEAVVLSLITGTFVVAERRLGRRFPGILLALVLGIVYSRASGYGGPILGPLDIGSWGPPQDIPWQALPSLLVPGILIAVIGYSEALSIAQIFAEKEGQEWSARREFVSQGVANLGSAFAGSFPVGGSFSRSAINHVGGAVSPWSGAVTGLTVVMLLPFSFLLEPLPKAVLGASVIAAIAPLLSPRPLIDLWRRDRARCVLASLTFVGTVAASPRLEFAVVVAALLGYMLDRVLPTAAQEPEST